MVILGTVMTGIIAYSEISAVSSSTLSDKLIMTPLIAFFGFIASIVIALIIWVVEYLQDHPSSCDRNQGPKQ